MNPTIWFNDGQIGADLVVTTDPAPGATVPSAPAVTLKISTGQVADAVVV